MNEDREQNVKKQKLNYTGSGMALGAALGLIFGLLLFDSLALGLVAGVAIGLLIGAIADLQTAKKRHS